eukprot:TRINITY_DN2145_c0_g1_i6.p4 TRINITY_DN2145_c0_g1~~TRINITY_DN2145_c0_g1_i6.p4  ORF type:complete len:169 (+),score=49.38 TRINITY_DN2145_c0_g1_i6:1497-2003(+)
MTSAKYRNVYHKEDTADMNDEGSKDNANTLIETSNSRTGVADDSGVFLIDIIDTGIGISEKEQKQVFKTFKQANDGVKTKYGGTGLGLWITRQIVYLMNGFIKLRSQPQKGTRFTISLPFKIVEYKSPSPKSLMRRKKSDVNLQDKASVMLTAIRENKKYPSLTTTKY